MWLTSLSIRRPLLVIMAVLAIMLGGVLAYTTLAVDLLPNVKFPYVAVVVNYPGAGPREVEARVTKPIENSVAGSPGIKRLISTSGDGYSMLLMEYKDGMDPDAAAQDIDRRVSQVRASLPEDALAPSILKFNPSDQPIIVAGVYSVRGSDELFQLVDDMVRPRLEAVDGVASVQLLGGREREIVVAVDRARLDARGLSLAQVTSALAAANLSVPSGYIQEGSREFNVRVYGLYQEVDRLADLVVAAPPGGSAIRLRDVASVSDSHKKQRYMSRVNGREGVALLINKQQTANTVAVSEGVQRAFGDLSATLPVGVEFATVVDSALFVHNSLASVENNLRDAVLIVAFVLLLFLHTWRSTLIVLISIPTSLIATVAVMWFLGFTINMMSMMGLSLTIGILVDDSIVILENIYRHMKLGQTPWTAAIEGRREIGAAAVAITLVDVVVYTPLAFLTGLVGQFFKEFAGAIAVATLFSLLVSFTLTPMLASRWLTATDEERSPLAPLWRRWEDGYQALTRLYRRTLEQALRLRWLVLASGLAAFLGGIALVAFGVVGNEFMTQADQGEFVLAVDLPAGTALSTTNDAVQELETKLARVPEMESFLSTVGTGGQHGRGQARSARIYIRLKPVSQRARTVFEVSEEVRTLASDIPGVKARVNLPSVAGYSNQPILISVRGPEVETLTKLGEQVEEIVRRTPGTGDVTNSAVAGAPEMRLEIDHAKISDLGLTTAQVASAVRTAFEGTVATELRRENEDKVDIRVKYGGEGDSEMAAMLDIPIATPKGTTVKLGQVAALLPVEGPAEIERQNRMRQVEIGANLTGRPLGEVVSEIRAATDKLALPAGYSLFFAGDAELQEDAFSSIGKAMLIGIVLMYMLMVALYNSLVYPLVIMGAVPVAAVGAIGALALTGNTLNMFSLTGMIMLVGLVGKNAILLVDYTNTLRERGYSRWEAILEAGPTRLRPIVMTTAAMVFAMVPLALRIGEGAETRSPMAVVVIGGLLASTLLTLVVVPAGYTVMDDLQGWVGSTLGRRRRVEAAEAAEELVAERSRQG